MPHVNTVDLTPEQARKLRESSTALKAIAKGPLREKTPVGMRALQTQMETNQKSIREITELKSDLREHRADTHEHAQRHEAALKEVRDEIKLLVAAQETSNGFLEKIAEESVKRSAIASEAWLWFKRIAFGALGLGGAGGTGWGLFG